MEVGKASKEEKEGNEVCEVRVGCHELPSWDAYVIPTTLLAEVAVGEERGWWVNGKAAVCVYASYGAFLCEWRARVGGFWEWEGREGGDPEAKSGFSAEMWMGAGKANGRGG